MDIPEVSFPGAHPLEAAKLFDVSHHHDALYEGTTNNPFSGISLVPGVMVPFQRSDMEERLHACIQEANALHWGITTVNGMHVADLLALREPTAKEAKSLKLAPDADRWAREAAQIRAYLVHFDAVDTAKRKKEFEDKRDSLRRRAKLDPVATGHLRREMAAVRIAAMRHQRRLDDERAFHEYMLAKSELDDMERKARIAEDELRALERKGAREVVG